MSVSFLKKHKIKGSKKLSIIFVLVSVLLFFLIIVNVSDIFSSVITNKNSLFFTKKIEVPSYSVYAVSINDFNNIEEANEVSLLVKEKGGAGVVYESGEKFVFVSAYPTLIEAKEIQQNLINLGYNSRIVNIKIDSLLKEYKGSNSQIILEAINFFRGGFLKVYETTIIFDKGDISRTKVKSILTTILTNITTIQNKLNTFKQEEDLALKQLIFVPLNKIKGELESALFCIENDYIFTSKLKEISFSFALKNKEFINKINMLN